MANMGEWVNLGGCSDDDGFGEDEELLLSSEKVASLERDVQERDAKVASLSRDVQERDAMIAKLKHEMEQIKKDRDASREDMVNLEKGIFANVLPAYTQETSMLIIEKDREIKRLRDSWNDVVAQLEVSLREIRGLKHEASVKCNDVVDANQSHKVRIIEMEKELDILKQANPSFKAFIIPLKKQMTSLRKRLSNIHDKHDKLLKELIEFSVCCTWRNRQWSLERPRGEPFAKIEEILMDFKKEKYMKGLDSKGYNTKV
jgi:chromosome segregation ATPase